MRSVIAIILWFILLSICWPLALVVVLLLPLFWLILLPFGILGLTLGLVFQLVGSILTFPFRVARAK